MTTSRGGAAPLLGIDWGTTNRRAYVLDHTGTVLHQHADDQGILAVAGKFEESVRNLLDQFELSRADVVMSGMVGSRNGWRDVPYLDTTHRLTDLPQALRRVEHTLSDVSCRIAPGYRFTDASGMPDVMRGEETQLLGALKLGAPDGWFLHPGTHSKWVLIEDGCIRGFFTFMTGELFALLSERGTLAAAMQQNRHANVMPAFEAGLDAARNTGSFTHLAFCCRALVVTDSMPASHAASWLSGLLIGSELAQICRRDDRPAGSEATVQLIGAPELAAHYAQAMPRFGLRPRIWDPDQAYVAALCALAGINDKMTREQNGI